MQMKMEMINMILRRNINNEYVAYTYINGILRSVGVFWTIGEARDYCIKNYRDYKIEKVIENHKEPLTEKDVMEMIKNG